MGLVPGRLEAQTRSHPLVLPVRAYAGGCGLRVAWLITA
jgi:hypothetical protein